MKIIRCDIYTPNEFRAMFRDSEIVNEYIAENPKDTYNTDDEIAVCHKRDERFVGRRPGLRGMYRCNGLTTKRYDYPEDARHSH